IVQNRSLSEREYYGISDGTMYSLTESLERLVEQQGGRAFGEIFFYLRLKQSAKQEIWLSSPVSGPKRYSYDAKEQMWFYPRDESTLKGLLERSLKM
ncbi:hypothetical protein BT69DRAFT_1224596, partial [Atractiella rhizophila]